MEKQDSRQCCALIKVMCDPLVLAGMVGFFLNAISIVSFLTVKEMRNPSNFFVFNLAVADLCLNINGLTAAYASYVRYECVTFSLISQQKTSSIDLEKKKVTALRYGLWLIVG